jgi:hypothetical protein
LIRLSWLRRFIKDSKGVSTAIGTVLLIVALFAVISNVFMWTISQSTQYSESVRKGHQTDTDRFNEKITASNGSYSVWGNTVTVEPTLTNVGAMAAQIINLWVFDTTQQRYGFNDTISSLNLNLNPGQILDLTGSEAITVAIPGVSSTDDFNSWFVTARGNTVPVTEAELNGTIIAEVAHGIGKVGMDFDTFIYYHVISVEGGKYGLQEYPNGLEGFDVPGSTDIAFRVILTNYDVEERTINLNSHSVLWMIFPTNPQQVRCSYWYIVNIDDNGTIEDTFSTVSLLHGVPTMVYFASSEDLGPPWSNFSPSNSKYTGPAAVNLMLFGTIGTHSYGQNIPFVSVYVT